MIIVDIIMLDWTSWKSLKTNMAMIPILRNNHRTCFGPMRMPRSRMKSTIPKTQFYHSILSRNKYPCKEARSIINSSIGIIFIFNLTSFLICSEFKNMNFLKYLSK